MLIFFLDSFTIRKLWTGDWSIENFEFCKEFLLSGLEDKTLKDVLKKYHNEENSYNDILHLAICVFLTFCDKNWSPHCEELSISDYFKGMWPSTLDASLKLHSDSEPVHSNIMYPELLYFAIQVFTGLCYVQGDLVRFM